MSDLAPVTAAIITKDPDMVMMAKTLTSLADQNRPPAEIVIIDSTDGGPPMSAENVPDMSGCSCGGGVADALRRLQDQGVDIRVRSEPNASNGGARWHAVHEADQDYVWHLDEDSVIVSPDWIEVALDRLQDPDVSAVGGRAVEPVRGNSEGRAIVLLEEFFPVERMSVLRGGRYIMHRRELCIGDRCFTPGQGRGEDATIRNRLAEQGSVVKESRIAGMKDLPTTRQVKARNVALSIAGGAVAGAFAGILEDEVRRRVF